MYRVSISEQDMWEDFTGYKKNRVNFSREDERRFAEKRDYIDKRLSELNGDYGDEKSVETGELKRERAELMDYFISNNLNLVYSRAGRHICRNKEDDQHDVTSEFFKALVNSAEKINE
jgi:hypothetical protein